MVVPNFLRTRPANSVHGKKARGLIRRRYFCWWDFAKLPATAVSGRSVGIRQKNWVFALVSLADCPVRCEGRIRAGPAPLGAAGCGGGRAAPLQQWAGAFSPNCRPPRAHAVMFGGRRRGAVFPLAVSGARPLTQNVLPAGGKWTAARLTARSRWTWWAATALGRRLGPRGGPWRDAGRKIPRRFQGRAATRPIDAKSWPLSRADE